eukprot:gene6950-7730_t
MSERSLENPEHNQLNRHEVGVIRRKYQCHGRHTVKVLNLLILAALGTFVILRIHNGVLMRLNPTPVTNNVSKSHQNKDSNAKLNDPNKNKTIPLKVPWRFQVEDDSFEFPKNSQRKERYITFRPSALRWSKQLLQFENAVIFAYLLKRTLLVPPLLPPRVKTENRDNTTHSTKDNNGTVKHDRNNDTYELPLSRIVDFNALSKVIRLEDVSIGYIKSFQASNSVYKICHDFRLGFWVDYIPSVENIQTWRLLKAQQFTAFPINLQNHESDLMCPGTTQYSNRWGPPMRIKPILRGILTELAKKEDDLIYFEGDTLSTRDIRFFDKGRTKELQDIMVYHMRFSKEINRVLSVQLRRIRKPYNAILSGPLSRNASIEDALKIRLKIEAFKETAKIIFIACRQEDEEKFQFIRHLGYEVIFGLSVIKRSSGNSHAQYTDDILRLCALILCSYATKFTHIGGSADLYYVEHLRLQNVTIIDGLLTNRINPRWAKHTTLPKNDERILLEKHSNAKMRTEKSGILLQHNRSHISVNDTLETSSGVNNTMDVKAESLNITTSTLKNKQMNKRKFKSKLDIMVCVFCNYIKRITGEHGCPKLKPFCP